SPSAAPIEPATQTGQKLRLPELIRTPIPTSAAQAGMSKEMNASDSPKASAKTPGAAHASWTRTNSTTCWAWASVLSNMREPARLPAGVWRGLLDKASPPAALSSCSGCDCLSPMRRRGRCPLGCSHPFRNHIPAGGVRLLSDADCRVEDRGCSSIDRFDGTIAFERGDFPYRGECAEHNLAWQTRQPVSAGVGRVFESGGERPVQRGGIEAAQASRDCHELGWRAKRPTSFRDFGVTRPRERWRQNFGRGPLEHELRPHHLDLGRI